jgi:dTDP-4-amino-4,6-dideoxygalactose transaminase
VRADTGTVDPQAVADLVGPRTVGVIAVDTVGLPADYAELRLITDRHGLFLVEDAACAVGATYKGREAGALAPVACLSFHGRKGATSGEGGALLTADPALAAGARLRSSFGIESIFDQAQVVGLPIPVFTEIGYNYKLSDIAAAILQVQLGRVGELMDRRRAVAAHYAELLADEELVTLPHAPTYALRASAAGTARGRATCNRCTRRSSSAQSRRISSRANSPSPCMPNSARSRSSESRKACVRRSADPPTSDAPGAMSIDQRGGGRFEGLNDPEVDPEERSPARRGAGNGVNQLRFDTTHS